MFKGVAERVIEKSRITRMVKEDGSVKYKKRHRPDFQNSSAIIRSKLDFMSSSFLRIK